MKRVTDVVGISLLIGERFTEEAALVYTFTLEKQISLEDLLRGAVAVMRRHLSLRSELVASAKGVFWKELARPSDEDALQALADELVQAELVQKEPGKVQPMVRLRDEAKPLWRVCLLQDGRLHLRMHHVMVDGLSSLLLAEELISVATGTPLAKVPWEVPLHPVLRFLARPWIGIRLWNMVRSLMRKAREAREDPPVLLGALQYDPASFLHAAERMLPESEIAALRARWKSFLGPKGRVPTVNDLLLAAFACAIASQREERPPPAGHPNANARRIALMIPVDLRSCFPSAQPLALGNQVGLLNVSARLDECADVQGALAAVMRQSASLGWQRRYSWSYTTLRIFLSRWLLPQVWGAWDRPPGADSWRNENTALFTNIGRYEFRVGTVIRKLSFGPLVRSPMGLTLGAYSLRGDTCLYFGASSGTVSPAELNTLAERVLANLRLLEPPTLRASRG